MSRLGKIAIPLPDDVEIKESGDGNLEVKGKKGALKLTLPKGIKLKIDGKLAFLERDESICSDGAVHGLYRSLLKNIVVGISTGYEVILSLIGVGYRAKVQGEKLDLQIGFSHPTLLEIPKSIEVVVEKGTTILVKGIDKQKVGQFAANIRAIRPPEPYKGKGIHYKGEYVRRKEGKKKA